MTTDIKKILDEIDGMREKSTQGEWVYGSGGDIDEDFWIVGEKSESVVHRGSDGDGGVNEANAALIVALHNSYPTLRDYIARLERESEAGKALAQYLMDGTLQEDDQMAISLYRTACEGEEKPSIQQQLDDAYNAGHDAGYQEGYVQAEEDMNSEREEK